MQVEQRHRDAAADLVGPQSNEGKYPGFACDFREGRCDRHELVQAFADFEAVLRSSIVEECAKADGWRSDMENAPRDGTRVDLWAYWPEHDLSRRTADAFWNGKAWQMGTFDETQFVQRPVISHWRPLPAAPTQTPETPNE